MLLVPNSKKPYDSLKHVKTAVSLYVTGCTVELHIPRTGVETFPGRTWGPHSFLFSEFPV